MFRRKYGNMYVVTYSLVVKVKRNNKPSIPSISISPMLAAIYGIHSLHILKFYSDHQGIRDHGFQYFLQNMIEPCVIGLFCSTSFGLLGIMSVVWVIGYFVRSSARANPSQQVVHFDLLFPLRILTTDCVVRCVDGNAVDYFLPPPSPVFVLFTNKKLQTT